MQRALPSLSRCHGCFPPKTGIRLLSTVPNSSFTSFFFHNSQWLKPRPCRRPQSFVHANTDVYASSLPLSAYRKTDTLSPGRLLKIYTQLSKSRLTTLVVLTAMSAVALSPHPTTVPILLSTAVGTALCSASANTLNQLQEIPFDAQMARTRMRPLVRRAISPLHAAGFALVTGIAGPAILWTMNPTTAMLGVANIVLYAGVYTWMKRRSTYNTWVGSVVGALPPLMGWAACGGQFWPTSDHPVQLFIPPVLSSGTLNPMDLSLLVDNPLAPLALFMLLFNWQFHHFNSLSYLVRSSYAQAGYQMLSVISPTKNALVSLRHALLQIPIYSILIPLSGLTTWVFALSSLIPNIICARAAWRFYRRGGEKEAKAVFQHSLWYLPVMLGLMMLHKQGMEWSQWLELPSTKEDGERKM